MNAAQRDERRNRLRPRVAQLLVTEIQGLESLFASTPKNAPDRPKLDAPPRRGLRRARGRRLPRQDRERHQGRRGEAEEPARPCRRSRPRPAKADKILAAARKAAIEYYTLLKTAYPKWCQNNERRRPDARARAARTRSSTTSPTSTSRRTSSTRRARSTSSSSRSCAAVEVHPQRVPRVRRALLQRGAGRPEQVGARRAGVPEVIKYPPPDNKVCGYAHYKLALRLLEQGRLRPGAHRVQEDDRVRRAVLAAPERGEARRLARGATSSRSTPSRATRRRRTTSSSRSRATRRVNTEKTFKMMDDLGPELPRHRPLSRRASRSTRTS